MTSYVLPRADVARLIASRGLRSAAELLPLLASSAKPLSGCLISGFEVGAAALGESGAVYLGTNVEFPGHQLQQSIHAEQFVVANAHAHGERGLVRLCVNAPPCGLCRQFLQELPNAGALQFEICVPALASFRAVMVAQPDRFWRDMARLEQSGQLYQIFAWESYLGRWYLMPQE